MYTGFYVYNFPYTIYVYETKYSVFLWIFFNWDNPKSSIISGLINNKLTFYLSHTDQSKHQLAREYFARPDNLQPK